MSWLRVDDGFAQHPKLVQLSPKDRWTWMEVLCYCARYQTEGRVPAGVREVIRGATVQFLRRCEELRLLDVDGDQFRVHDWEKYNPKDPNAAERMRRLRERTRRTEANAKPNENRTESEHEAEQKANGSGASRAGARARPVPSRPKEPSFLPSVLQDPGDGRTDDELEELAELTRLRETTLEGMPE